jgi:nucleoside-diphosphate-sugar epimerase
VRVHSSGGRVLITGGAGFIGGHLARFLTAKGSDVTVLDDLRVRPLMRPDHTVNFLQKPVTELTKRDLDGVRLVCHLASHKSVPSSFKRPLDYLDNVDSGRHLLDLCMSAGVPKVIVGSTCEVYGQAEELPTPEACPLSPRSPYAASKVALEMLARAHQRASDTTEIGIVRFFNVYGPGERPDALVPRLCANLLLRNELPVEGDGRQRRDFTYISDVVEKLAALMNRPLPPVANLGSGRSYSVNEIVQILREAAPDSKIVRRPARLNEIAEFRAGTTLQDRQFTGLPAKVGIAEGVRTTFAWWGSQSADKIQQHLLVEEAV